MMNKVNDIFLINNVRKIIIIKILINIWIKKINHLINNNKYG